MRKREKVTADNKTISFPLSVLRRECRKLFDISTSTFDGATYELDQKKEYTVEEIKNTIKKWEERSITNGRR